MNLKEQIEKYEPHNEQEAKDKETMLKYINTFDDVLTRNNEFGHFTASSWVVNKERTKVLMIYHNIYKSWSWTGGHADGESDLLQTAIRELKEETGIKNVKILDNNIFSLEIICVDGHVKRGKYVIMSAHQMATIEEFCTDILILNKGKTVLQGNLREIKEGYPANRLQIEFNEKINKYVEKRNMTNVTL